MKLIVYRFLLLLLSIVCLNETKAQQLKVSFQASGNDANYWYIDLLLSAGAGYVTNDLDYGDVNQYGSWFAMNYRFTVNSVVLDNTKATSILFTPSVNGITSGNGTFMTAGGCYAGAPAVNISLERNAPAPDAGPIPTKIGTISFPKTNFPSGVSISTRNTSSQLCASRESFWSNPHINNAGIRLQVSGSNSWALPLTLTSFTASEQNCRALLEWVTADEQNTSHFVIEQSTDGNTFNEIGNVTAQGNGPGKAYSYSLYQPKAKFFYRLRMVDLDGRFKYSAVKQLTTSCSPPNKLSIYPSPAPYGSSLTVKWLGSYNGKAKLSVYSIDGTLMMQKEIVFFPGSNTFSIPETARFLAGTYMLRITGNNEQPLISPTKFIIQ